MTSRGHRISRNFAVLSAGQVISRLFAFAVTIHLTRTLLAEHFGIVVMATSVLAYASLIVDFGFDTLGPIEVARRTTDVRDLVANVMSIKLLLTIGGVVALLLFTWIAPLTPLAKIVIVLYGISLVTNALDLDWVFLGSELMQQASVAEIVSQGVLTAGAFLFVHRPDDVSVMPWVFLASRLSAFAYLAAAYVRRFGAIRLRIDRPVARRLLRAATPFTATTFVTMISHNFDLLIVGIWVSSAAAGLYGAAYRVVWAPTILVTAYYAALRPALAAAYEKGVATVEDLLARSNRITAACAAGLVTGGVILAEPIIRFLYGKAYLPAVMPFRLLMVALGLLTVSRKYRLILTCFDHQSTDFRIMSAAAAANVGLNFALIPRFGTSGAAAASVCSELLILVAGYAATRLFIRHVPLGRHFALPAVSAAVMAGVLLSTGFVPVLLRIAAGGTVYLGMLLLLRVVTAEEIEMVLRSWAPGGAARSGAEAA